LTDFGVTALVESGGLWRTIADSCKQLQTVSDSYLSSVSPRHSYYNWASLVTGIIEVFFLTTRIKKIDIKEDTAINKYLFTFRQKFMLINYINKLTLYRLPPIYIIV